MLGLLINTVVAIVLLAFSIVWIPLTYLAQGVHFLWRKLLGLDT
jgi:hypothetical protein